MLAFIRRNSGSKIFLLTLRSLDVIFVRSHLEYTSEIWSPNSLAIVKEEGVQRRATRLTLRVPYVSYN